MSRLTKILTGIAMAAIAVAVVSVPVKADAASEAYEAGLKQLEQIAKETEISAAANEAAAKEGLRLALARQAELDAAAKAGMVSGHALHEQIAKETAAAAAAHYAAAASGLAK